MVKRYVDYYVGLYNALLLDATYARPTLGSEFARDSIRLRRLIDQRGLPFLMVDLPAMGKHLDRCLAEGKYKLSGLPGSRRYSNRTPIPKLFRGLYLLIFDEDGTLKEDFDYEAVFLLRQFLYCAKKATVDCSAESEALEIQAFIDTDGLLPEPDPWWVEERCTENSLPFAGFSASLRYVQRSGQLPWSPGVLPEGRISANALDQSLLAMLDRIACMVTSALGPYRPEEWKFKHGPGVVSDVKPDQDRYRFELWPDRLEDVFPRADVAYCNYAWWADDAQGKMRTKELPHSRLIAVPKTLKKPRLIAAEPSAHMFCQQNIWHYFRVRCADTWLGDFVRFTDQSQNQELCLRGSLDGSLATIDLSAASDRVSCLCVGNMFRSNEGLLHALRSTRTHFCELPLEDSEGKRIKLELRKYSTMGNATTFPVESLIFLSIAIAACLVDELASNQRTLTERVRQLAGSVSVFGDDLIVPRDKVGLVVRLLTLLDFKVNNDKSFWTGRFRESCGVDAFGGHEITPVYASKPFDNSPESYAAAIDISNNLYRRFLVHAANYVQSTVGRIKFPVVPIDSGVVGFQSFVTPSLDLLKGRWHQGLQERQIRVPSFHTSNEVLPPADFNTCLLQYFTEEPDPFTMWTSGIRTRPVLKIKHRWVSATQYPTRTEGCYSAEETVVKLGAKINS